MKKKAVFSIIFSHLLFFSSCFGMGNREESKRKAIFAEVMAEVETMQGLQFRKAFPIQMHGPEGMKKMKRELQDRAMTPQDWESVQKTMTIMGYIQEGYDIAKTMKAGFQNYPGDLYDDTAGIFHHNIAADLSDPNCIGGYKSDWVRDFTEALYCQHFDVQALCGRAEENEDRMLARKAAFAAAAELASIMYFNVLSEKEIIAAPDLEDWILPRENSLPQRGTGRLPMILLHEGVFRNSTSLRWAHHYMKKGGWKELRRALAKELPNSTEQLLHTEKCFAKREEPVALQWPELEALMKDGWHVWQHSVIGELQTLILLEEWASLAAAKTGAQGWGGDRFATMENQNGKMAFVWMTLWDAEEDAEEFFDLWQSRLDEKYPGAKDVKSADNVIRKSDADCRELYAERRGNFVAVLEGFDREDFALFQDAIWKTRRME